MSNSFYNEDAEVRVGVIVRPLRGQWRPASGQTPIDDTKNTSSLDPSVWKNIARDYDNEAKMQFTSKMVYSNHKLNEEDNYETEVAGTTKQKLRPTISTDKDKSVSSSALVSRCPSTCKCGGSSSVMTANSPPPEDNRIKLPQDLADEEQDAWATKGISKVKGKEKKEKLPSVSTQMWTTKNKATSKDERRIEENQKISSRGSVSSSTGSLLMKDISDNRDSSEEIRVTTSPLPKPKKARPPTTASDKNAKADKPVQGITTNAEKQQPAKDSLKTKPRLSTEKAAALKDSDRLRVKFDLQDASKNYYGGSYSLQSSTKPSRAGSPKWKPAPGSETSELRSDTPTPRERIRPIRANLTTTSRSRLKTVTYKEEPFMSEFKSWVLLIIFLSMILLYRSTLFS